MTALYRVRTTLNYGAGGPGLVTHYFRPSVAGGTSGDALVAATGVRAFWVALAGQLTPSFAALVQGSIDTVEDTTGALVGGFSVTPPAAVVGTGSTSSTPPFACIVVEYGTATIVRGKRLRGRSYVGPLSLAATTATGGPTTAAGTATASAVAALVAVTPCNFVIWSRPSLVGGHAGSNGTVTGGQAWSSLGSLRSRRD